MSNRFEHRLLAMLREVDALRSTKSGPYTQGFVDAVRYVEEWVLEDMWQRTIDEEE